MVDTHELAEFLTTCWSLADAETFRREKAAMAFGATRWPEAAGTLLYHEYTPGRAREVPGALAAWKYLLPLPRGSARANLR